MSRQAPLCCRFCIGFAGSLYYNVVSVENDFRQDKNIGKFPDGFWRCQVNRFVGRQSSYANVSGMSDSSYQTGWKKGDMENTGKTVSVPVYHYKSDFILSGFYFAFASLFIGRTRKMLISSAII